jgi:hypothetical protein
LLVILGSLVQSNSEAEKRSKVVNLVSHQNYTLKEKLLPFQKAHPAIIRPKMFETELLM